MQWIDLDFTLLRHLASTKRSTYKKYSFSLQLSKLRLALDSETTAHANLVQESKASEKNATVTTTNSTQSSDYKWRGSNSADSTPKKSKQQIEADLTRGAFLIGQSEERVQALSVCMLHLHTALFEFIR